MRFAGGAAIFFTAGAARRKKMQRNRELGGRHGSEA
jgi:hypothetical protein